MLINKMFSIRRTPDRIVCYLQVFRQYRKYSIHKSVQFNSSVNSLLTFIYLLLLVYVAAAAGVRTSDLTTARPPALPVR